MMSDRMKVPANIGVFMYLRSVIESEEAVPLKIGSLNLNAKLIDLHVSAEMFGVMEAELEYVIIEPVDGPLYTIDSGLGITG